MHRIMMTIGLALFLPALATAVDTTAATPDTKAAQQILKETGVTGGLIVHLGCGDGKLTAALHGSDSFIVQGLDRDPQKVAAAKQQFIGTGLGGAVTARVLAGDRLPYAEEMVNLLVVSGDLGVSRDEMERVLVPGGVAVFLNPQSANETRKLEKPWPADIDEWTHYNHDSTQTAVSKDTRVGPPKRIKWIAPPLKTRRHFALSFTALVTARGRVFSIIDSKSKESDRSLPERNELVARDAFNGTLLWKYPLPYHYWIPPWTTFGHKGGTRVGITRPHMLTTDGAHVFLFTGAPWVLTVLDAATGKEITKLAGVSGLGELVQEHGLLVAAVRPPAASGGATDEKKGRPPLGEPELAAIRIGSWDCPWRIPVPGFQDETLTLHNGRVFYESDGNIVALDAKDGRELWRTTGGAIVRPNMGLRMWNLIATGDKLIVSRAGLVGPPIKGTATVAFDAATGRQLWVRDKMDPGLYGMFPVGDKLYVQTRALNLGDGSDAGTLSAAEYWSKGHHNRCYPWRATPRYLITNNRGCEFLAFSDKDQSAKNDYLRGNCSLGVFPANGLLYTPPHGCFCYNGVMQDGFQALAPAAAREEQYTDPKDPGRLQKGPAYAANPQSAIRNPQSVDWPMYRQNAKRLGTSSVPVGTKLAVRWNIAAGANLTPPVCAGGLLLVADKDTHRVLAFDASSGKAKWTFTADARLDSPPTIDQGRVLFGCTDGFVYCLDARDGALAWRFLAAPEERWIGVNGQLESAWPVHGSVLVEDGVAYVTAGRHTWFDSGIHAYALDPATGKVLHHRLLKDQALPEGYQMKDPVVCEATVCEGARSDLLVSDGTHLYLGPLMLDKELHITPAPYLPGSDQGVQTVKLTGAPYVDQRCFDKIPEEMAMQRYRRRDGVLGEKTTGLHLSATAGFLSLIPFERHFWMYAKLWPGHNHGNQGAKCGVLLCVDEDTTYGIKIFNLRQDYGAVDPELSAKGQLLCADANDNEPVIPGSAHGIWTGLGYTRTAPPKWFQWEKKNLCAMTVAGDRLYVAGAPLDKDRDDPFAPYEGRAGSTLLTFDKKTGEKLAELALGDQPVFDGLIAAAGRLYASTVNGKILCLGESNTKTNENVK